MSFKVRVVEAPQTAARKSATIEIPEAVKMEIETVYRQLSEKPGSEGMIEFDSVEVMDETLAQIRAYCDTREAGELKFRKLPSKGKNLPETSVRFQIRTLDEVAKERDARIVAKNERAERIAAVHVISEDGDLDVN
jgi:hypothetical protein